MSTLSDLSTYGISRDQAWRMLPGWAQRELGLRHEGPIPLASMIDAMTWARPAPRATIDEELHWIAIYGASARRAASSHLRLIRVEPGHRDGYRARLRQLRAEHSLLMARRGHLLRLKARERPQPSPGATDYRDAA